MIVKLKDELPGILNWALEGCLEWQLREGLGEPEEVLQATDTYRADMDIIGQFIKECCLVGPQYKSRSTNLYDAYKHWCAQKGEHAEMSHREFGRYMSDKFERYTSNGIWYQGIGLLTKEESTEQCAEGMEGTEPFSNL